MSDTPSPKPVNLSPASGHQHAHDPTQAVRRLQNNTQFSSRSGTAAYGAQLQAPADPNSKLVGFKTGFQDTGRLCVGLIVDGTAIANCYKVFVEKARAPIIASALSSTSHAAFGASAINSYAPGTSVILMIHDKIGQGYILGAAPSVLDVGARAYHDYVSQASRKRVDDCHKKYLKEPMSGQMVDWSNWRPWDGTLGGEWGVVSTTGIGVSVDDFMMKAAVNEFCGVYGFYHDSLLRLAGYNMQVWTAGSERDAYMDQAECNDTTGYAPYPWEAVGILTTGTAMIEEYAPKDYQSALGKPYYSHWENKHEFQQPYHRTQKFFGYLGQGARAVVHAPPKNLDRWTYKPGQSGQPEKPYDSQVTSADGFAPDTGGGGAAKLRTHQERPAFGLSEVNTALDGRYFVASAKGIVLSKRPLLPMPQRLKRPDSGEGDDTEQAYKAAGKFGNGPDHKITGDIKTTDENYPNLQRAAAVLDLHGYLFNYAGLHPFYWHAKDYKTWEQSELEYAQCNQRIPQFSDLASSKMYLKQAEPKQFKIDHRYNTQNFYETECFLSLLEDGSVVIGDGYGAEIRMSGGCIFLSAPGDVWLKGGRDVQTWAGNDAIIKAKNGVDISTTEKNVRIKAEANVMVLAGNDSSTKEGGILLESRMKTQDYDFEQGGDEVKFAGIVMRAPNANVVSLAHQIYLRTGGGGSSIKPGNITIDAGKGEKEIVTKSNNFYEFLQRGGRHYQFFGLTDYQKANMFSENFTLLSGAVGTENTIIAGGGLLAKASILVAKGHIITEAAAKGSIFVAPCDGDCQSQVNKAIDEIRKLIDDDIPQIGAQIDHQLLEQLWYADKKAGNPRVMDTAEFSFRTDDNYNIEDFVLYEDRWQQMARIGGAEPDKWTEKAVTSKVISETWPFPGKKWLSDQPAYVEQALKIAEKQDEGLRDKNRGSAPNLADDYSAPEFKSSEPKTLNGNYPIIPRK
jgi:hypothetical protein